MIKIQHVSTICLLILLLFPSIGLSSEQKTQHMDWKYNQIQPTSSRFMESTGSDPYIVFPLIEETLYDVSGIQLEIAFNPLPIKPVMMELFWRPDFEGFSEFRKVFFVLLPPKTGDTLKFFIPLKNQTGYKRFRLDFPRDLATPFLVKDFSIIQGHQQPQDVETIEPIQNLTITEARRPEIIIPYLLHTLKHGTSRFLKDPGFFIFWIFMILTVLVSIRIVSRSVKNDET